LARIRKRDIVVQRNGLKNSAKFVKTVLALSDNPQMQVDLCKRWKCELDSGHRTSIKKQKG
jgi:hypothetical protein